ncbi:hypothetical protein DH2020_042703 [Rehmannia glutinosa]|uniref:PB1 domain-containing protein n=1 Tax=Rehmannia glutinosa TaxID=99300 RepID=A0ABR0UNQ0_REHGL
MEAAVVIKVKYGDMLRRFNVPIIEEELKLSMDGLREKIVSIFDFDHGTELMLTYTDEDGDIVTLVDDVDLTDAVKQCLNPLRINVKLISKKSYFRVSDIVKTVSEPLQPLRKTFVKLSADLRSKTSSSASGFMEYVDYYSKVGFSYLDKLSPMQPSTSCYDIHLNSPAQTTISPKDSNLSKNLQGPTTLPQDCNMVSEIESCMSKLDSCFIEDVSVINGTILAPSTPFTNIWRMRNNGMTVWPEKTQLVWIGGDRLSHQSSVEVEIPAAGLAVDHELDIAVDLISPEVPGGYISYWRLVSPSGEKFGQCILVLIQVDASVEEASCESGSLIDTEIEAEAIVKDNQPETGKSGKRVELVEPVVDLKPNNFNGGRDSEEKLDAEKLRMKDYSKQVVDDLCCYIEALQMSLHDTKMKKLQQLNKKNIWKH